MKKKIKHKNKKANKITIIKLLIIFILPLILTTIISISKNTTCEYIDEESRRMVAPAAPHPYLSQLFADVFLQLGLNWSSFCIKNECFSKEHSLPFDMAFRLEGASNFTKIHYGETKCTPIFKHDIFYDVVLGEFVIPNKEWVKKHFESDGDYYKIKFKIDEVMNFKVYSKLSVSAIVTIYLLFVAAVFVALQIILAIYRFLFVTNK